MSFSKDTKIEMLENLSKNQCCEQSFLTAIIKSCAEICVSTNGIEIQIKSQLKELYNVIYNLLDKLYNYKPVLQIREDSFSRADRYFIILDKSISTELILSLGIAGWNQDNCLEFNEYIDKDILINKCCQKTFVKGVFIGCGSISGIASDSRSVDYHLEFVFSNENLANEVMEILATFNILARKINRKKSFVIYLQKFEQISDFLTICDASHSMLELNNEYAKRTMKNSLNRLNNCENANITKTITASVEQVDAISYIISTIGIEALPDELTGICMLRLANSEESLNELAKLSGMSRSAINHRLNKILKIAEMLRED